MQKKSPSKTRITSKMTIGQILKVHPKSADIMQQFGLHCFGCSINGIETLEQGILGHGMPKSILKKLLEAMNDDIDQFNKDLTQKGIALSEKAALKIVEIARNEGGKNHGIRIKMQKNGGCCKTPTYSMDFEKKAKKGDEILGFHHGVTLFIDQNSFKKMRGSTIDYIVSYEAEGFKIENPNIGKNTCECKT